MSKSAQRFPYLDRDPALGAAGLAPFVPITLTGKATLSSVGLVDSGASMNVMPLSVGLQLGFDWAKERRTLQLAGNLSTVEAKAIVVTAGIGNFRNGSTIFVTCYSPMFSRSSP